MKDIVIGCDDAAVELKNICISYMQNVGINVEDMGVFGPEDDTLYPLVAEKVCRRIIDSGYTKEGVLICGTGIGMSMTANKFPGIFAAVCHDNFSAERARLSNDSNVLCFGARVIGPELAKKILGEWLNTSYVKGTRSEPKVDAIHAIDKENVSLGKGGKI